jgi:hypothetical protein
MLGYFDAEQDLTDAALYATAVSSYPQATTLPTLAYRSKAFSDLEDEKVWTRNWVCIGTSQRIPAAGDLYPFTVGNHGIHVQRQPDGTLRGHFNFAQHGGCRFVPRQCQTGKKTSCFYTSCGHSRDREVIRSAEGEQAANEMYMYVGVNPLKLLPIRVHEWGPLLFVNIDLQPGASPWSELNLPASAGSISGARHKARMTAEVSCNWKLAAPLLIDAASERHCIARPSMSALASAHEARRQAAFGFAVRHGSVETPAFGIDALPRLAEPQGDQIVWLAPNLVLMHAKGVLAAVVLQPSALDATLLHVDLFDLGHGAVSGTTEAVWRDLLQALIVPAAARQRGVASVPASPILPGTRGEALPTQEADALAWAFNRYLVERLLARYEYVDRPLYTHPGRSLNAGVNSGAF